MLPINKYILKLQPKNLANLRPTKRGCPIIGEVDWLIYDYYPTFSTNGHGSSLFQLVTSLFKIQKQSLLGRCLQWLRMTLEL